MLGRTSAKLGQVENAARHYQQLRGLVEQSASDPLGLAVTSLGEEAGLHLAALKAGTFPAPKVAVPRMVKLYLGQAAQGYAQRGFGRPGSGFASLRIAARFLAEHPKLLAAGLADPWVQQVMTAYAISRQDFTQPDYPQSALEANPPVPADLAGSILRAVENTQLTTLRGADGLAYLLYEVGDFPRAARFAKLSEAPMALWVRAQLALRAGKQNESEGIYAQLAERLRTDGAAAHFDVDAQCEYLRAEQALHGYLQGRKQAAMWQFDALSGFANDAVYIAEQELSTAQLKAAIDAQLLRDRSASRNLQRVLAKRYLRAGEHVLARKYFADQLSAAADAYMRELDLAERANGVRKARALFAAAWAVKQEGYEFFSPELPYYFRIDRELERAEGDAQAPAELQLSPRFHAAQLARQTADWLPKKSAAFAAVLCQASFWAMPKHPSTARAYYQHYVKHGAHVAWGKDFGTSRCPAADFELTQRQLDEQAARVRLRALRDALRGGLAQPLDKR